MMCCFNIAKDNLQQGKLVDLGNKEKAEGEGSYTHTWLFYTLHVCIVLGIVVERKLWLFTKGNLLYMYVYFTLCLVLVWWSQYLLVFAFLPGTIHYIISIQYNRRVRLYIDARYVSPIVYIDVHVFNSV